MVDRDAFRDELDRVGRLLEEERRLARRIGAHLARMRGVVAADAVDAAHLEALSRSDDGDVAPLVREQHFARRLRVGTAKRPLASAAAPTAAVPCRSLRRCSSIAGPPCQLSVAGQARR